MNKSGFHKIVKMKYLVISLSFFILAIIAATFFIASHFMEKDITSEELAFEALKTLPYLSWMPIKKEDEAKNGVTRYDPALSYEGINIYNSHATNSAYLMDMRGRKIHTWSLPASNWYAFRMNGKGDLFFIERDKLLAKIGWDSKLLWKNKARFHHYINLAENGDIYSLTRRKIEVQYKNQTIPILNDFITILSSDGKVKKNIPIFKLFKKNIPEEKLDKVLETVKNNNIDKIGQKHTAKSRLISILEDFRITLYRNRQAKKERSVFILFGKRLPEKILVKILRIMKNNDIAKEEDSLIDVFHTNSVEVINRDIEGLCKKGDVLISIRELNLIAIIDIEKEKVVWDWGKDDLDGQHAPTLLKNGNILIFDNGRYKRKYSRVIELNPATKEIVWEYKAKPPASFFSYANGSTQHLPNGNILVTETCAGRAFEVTKDGKIVWEYYNPERKNNMRRGGILDMVRISSDKIADIKRANEVR